ncbi:MAG: recombinase family protein [Planctomycetota bacterium]|jgi:hypothetical protein
MRKVTGIIAHSKTRTVGYVRRSTDRQEQSINDQKEALKLYAAENGLQFLKFYIDDAISGTRGSDCVTLSVVFVNPFKRNINNSNHRLFA